MQVNNLDHCDYLIDRWHELLVLNQYLYVLNKLDLAPCFAGSKSQDLWQV